ncbi:MAG: phosphoribosylformylglycinamidine synthase [Clostridia bacterium]|nr:phosphoribosylformylglycinamidine synthase [Clostridia bacterium]
MIYRIYVEKKPGFDVARKKVFADVKNMLGINLENLRYFLRYDVEGLSAEDFEKSKSVVFSEPPVDSVFEFIEAEGKTVFATEYLPGQFDQRADSAAQCVQLLTLKDKPLVKTANVYVFDKVDDESLAKIKNFLINPVEMREADLARPQTLKDAVQEVKREVQVDGFANFSDSEIADYHKENGFAMTVADLLFVRNYFKGCGRDPYFTELKVIDTYWSDHCRHTTFATELTNVKIISQNPHIQAAFDHYTKVFNEVSAPRGKYMCMMDIATCIVKYMKKYGVLKNLDESDEINACSVKVNVTENGKEETYLLMFKNETHNHPTEIEPFGGAATCLGGAIRDPLSGRTYVYHAMRITGAADITQPIDKTLKGKLPQRIISKTATSGFSSYGNQIGLATGFVQEVYHPNYVAKRLETGFVVAQNKAENVVRSKPQAGDVVILLGGATGRDGCGGATGSSKSHNAKSVESCGAEVQKGNATTERKIQRLFKNPAVSKLIKKCNDFGAGGVSVAIGELADSIDIFLDRVPKKYEGLSGTELAISESQERMAVVIDAKDEQKFIDLCYEENLSATNVAQITDTGRLRMFFKEDAIVDIERSFLDTNGVKQSNDVTIEEDKCTFFDSLDEVTEKYIKEKDYVSALVNELGRLNVCSQKGMVETFDSTIGARSVLLPYGGKMQETPAIVMAAKLGTDNSDTASVASFGFNPHLTQNSPFVGSVYAVLTSVSKLIAAGVNRQTVYLSLQEFFKRLNGDAKRFGQPVSALLGAFEAQMGLDIAAIGGKDSMSGSFEDIDVPATLISFAIGTAKCKDVIDNVLRQGGKKLYLLPIKRDENYMPDFNYAKVLFDEINKNILNGNVKYATVVEDGGVYSAVVKSVFGNGIGVDFEANADFFRPDYANIVVSVESDDCFDGFDKVFVGTTNESGKVSIGGKVCDLAQLLGSYKNKLEKVYPTTAPAVGVAQNVSFVAPAQKAKISIAKPKVFIPVFPGNNCEYDTARQFELAGAQTNSFVLKNLSSKDIMDSVQVMAKAIDECNILAIPGGFSGADEPDGSGKFIATVLSNPYIKESIEKLLEQRDGLIIGICNGFQALIKLGLVPNGKIAPMTDNSPTLTFNNIGRHISQITRTRVASNLSPWLQNVKVGDVYDVAISHGEGRFVCDDENLAKLIANGQIATQYVDFDGNATMTSPFNPNGSVYAIEGITSADGRVLGKMGHSERIGENLYKNIDGNYDMKIFKSGVEYFK